MFRFASFAALAVGLAAAANAASGVELAQAKAPARAGPAAHKQITRAEFLKGIDNRFNGVDTNHDGAISKAEAQAAQGRALQKARAAEQQKMDAEFKKLDTNKDKQLSLAEFRAAAPNLHAKDTPDELVAELDANKDGKISRQEYQSKPLANFNQMDSNHDGTVTTQELHAARSSK